MTCKQYQQVGQDTLTLFHPLQLLNCLTPEENTGCQHGLYFQDGERRVDYILTYHIKKPSSSRSNRQSSRFTDNAFTRSLRRGTARLGRVPPPQPRGDPEVASQDLSMDYNVDDKRLHREEFEGNLRDMGMELEKDEDVSCFSTASLFCSFLPNPHDSQV
uniref:Anoctamin dimerisation domain-containing protein n=1 Tax=Hucho hucho TaxID=62062 RepID=A0A4W5PLY0_9TELE